MVLCKLIKLTKKNVCFPVNIMKFLVCPPFGHFVLLFGHMCPPFENDGGGHPITSTAVSVHQASYILAI